MFSRRDTFAFAGLVPLTSCLATAGMPPTRPCTLYDPEVRHLTLVDGPNDPEGWIYNHDSSIVGYGGLYFLFWNASTSTEGAKGQVILMKRATSIEGLASGRAERCFADIPADDGAQWQPGTAVVGNELWVLWCQTGGRHAGTYFSRLASPDGTFQTKRLNLSLREHGTAQSAIAALSGDLARVPVPDETDYDTAFITGDIVDIALPGGRRRLLAPVVFESTSALTPDWQMPRRGQSTFVRQRKLAGFLIDDGDGWRTGGLVTVPGAPWAPWEPALSVDPDGRVRIWVRSFDVDRQRGANMLTATSDDHGASFSMLRPAGVDVPSSRPAVVLRRDGLALMLQNDNLPDAGDSGSPSARRNLALWMACGDGFLPGIRLSDEATDSTPCYPSARIVGGRLLVSYSSYERHPAHLGSRIKVAVLPVPPGGGVIMPRGNARDFRSPKVVADPDFAFLYRAWSRIGTARQLDELGLSSTMQTLVADVEPNDYGTLLDARGPRAEGWLLRIGHTLSLGLFGPDGTYKDIDSGVATPIGARLRIAVTVDAGARVADVAVNGARARLALPFVPASLAPASKAWLGCARPGSALGALAGRIAFIRIWNDRETTGRPAIDFDAAAASAASNNADWLSRFTATGLTDGRVEVVSLAGRTALRIAGTASASVLPFPGTASTAFAFDYQAMPQRDGEAVLCTVGDAVNAAMLVLLPGGDVILRPVVGGAPSSDIVVASTPQRTQVHRVRAKIDGERIGFSHDGGPLASTRSAGRPFFFLGKGWDPSPVRGANAFFVFADSVSCTALQMGAVAKCGAVRIS